MFKGSKIKSYLLAGAILLAAVGFFAYLKATKPHQPPVAVKEKVWPVEVQPLHLKTWHPVAPLYGKVEAPQLVKVVAPMSGVVAQLPVREGQTVEKGQLLVALSKADRMLPVQKAQAQLAQAQAEWQMQQLATDANQAQLAQAQAILQLKKTAVHRTQQLIKKHLASQSALDLAKEAVVRQQQAVTQAQLAVSQQQARLQQLHAQVQAAEVALAQAKLNAERAYVVAPAKVRIAQVQVAQGDHVNTNTPLLSYYEPQQLEIRSEMPTTLFDRLYSQWQAGVPMVAQTVSATGPVSLNLVRFAAQAQTGTIEAFFKPMVTDRAEQFTQKPEKFAKNAKIPSPALLPGALWHFDLSLPAEQNSFAVPYTALYGMDHVYLLENGRLQKLKVQLLGDVPVSVAGQRQKWALLKPLQPVKGAGVQVMVTHLPNAIEGLKVKPVDQAVSKSGA